MPTPYEHDAPLDRLLRAMYERHQWSLPVETRQKFAALLGKPPRKLDEWEGDQPLYLPEEPLPRDAMIVVPQEDHLWESSY